MTRTVVFLLCNPVVGTPRQNIATKNNTMTFDKYLLIDGWKEFDISESHDALASAECYISSQTSDQIWTSNINHTNSFQRCQKKLSKLQISALGLKHAAVTTASVSSTYKPCVQKKRRKAANARERCRMKKINTAFNELRQKVPSYNESDRLSKYDTLLMAQQYICALQDLLQRETERERESETDITDEKRRNS